MTTQQPEALRLADICAKKGLFAVEDELRRLHAESEQHLQELRSYRITVENREARIGELDAQLIAEAARTAEQKLRADQLEKQHAMQAKMHAQAVEQLAAAQQGARNRVLVDAGALQMVVNALRRDALEGRPSRGEMADELLSSATHPTTQGLDAQDAARWREVRRHIGAENQLGGAHYVIRGLDAPVNVMRGSVAEHFTKSIDAAIAAQAKQAEAMEVSRSGGCGCCSNACADRPDGCRFVHESPGAADMAAAQAKQGGV